MTTKPLNRRDFLKLAGLTSLGIAGACGVPPANSIPTLGNPYLLNTPHAQSTHAAAPTTQPTASSPTAQSISSAQLAG